MLIKNLILYLIVLSVQLVASPDLQSKNLIYIVLEGTSRSTLYSLIEKNKLTHIPKIINQGNYRNLEIETIPTTYDDIYMSLLTGYDQDKEHGTTQNAVITPSFFQALKQESDLFESIILFTPQDNPNLESPFNQFITELVSSSHQLSRIKHATSYEIGLDAVAAIQHVANPFILFLNFTNIDRIGKRYREGGELYSQAILNCDRAIGLILKELNNQNKLDNTAILVTTTYGMEAKSKFKSELTWVISNEKTQRKGRIQDIVPSLFDLIDIVPTKQRYRGESIFIKKDL